jgi:hypothetical protein
MVSSYSQGIDTVALHPFSISASTRSLLKPTLVFLYLLLTAGIVYAQEATANSASESAEVISGSSDTTVFGVGHAIRITGQVKGAIGFGGDVIVEGTVDGDVAAIGGSVIQAAGATIKGDVIVIGGSYKPVDQKPNRSESSTTIMYAGYQEELRNLMRSPSDLLRPQWSPADLGLRLLAILFWFVVSLALTAAMPGTISRGVARLQLTMLRVAIIGIAGGVVIAVVVPVCLLFLPSPVSTLVSLIAMVLILISGLFGRVVIYAATGRWLQRKYFPFGRNSESAALLMGTTFWIMLASLPYIWPVVATGLIVVSLGLALTARYRLGWRRPQSA